MYYTFDTPKDVKELHTPAVYKVKYEHLKSDRIFLFLRNGIGIWLDSNDGVVTDIDIMRDEFVKIGDIKNIHITTNGISIYDETVLIKQYPAIIEDSKCSTQHKILAFSCDLGIRVYPNNSSKPIIDVITKDDLILDFNSSRYYYLGDIKSIHLSLKDR